MSQTKINTGMIDASGTPGSGNFLRGDGAWQSTGGAWTLIGTQVASGSASLTQTGLTTSFDTYVVVISGLMPATDDTVPAFRLGDSSGIDSGASDYGWGFAGWLGGSGAVNPEAFSGASDDYDDAMDIFLWGPTNGVGSAAGEGLNGIFYLHAKPGEKPQMSGHFSMMNAASTSQMANYQWMGIRHSAITVDRIQIYMSSGNITTCRMSTFGISYS